MSNKKFMRDGNLTQHQSNGVGADLLEISYLPPNTLKFRTTFENMRTLRRYAWRTSRGPGLLHLPGNLFRCAGVQAAKKAAPTGSRSPYSD
jgi:hypothetical protein